MIRWLQWLAPDRHDPELENVKRRASKNLSKAVNQAIEANAVQSQLREERRRNHFAELIQNELGRRR